MSPKSQLPTGAKNPKNSLSPTMDDGDLSFDFEGGLDQPPAGGGGGPAPHSSDPGGVGGGGGGRPRGWRRARPRPRPRQLPADGVPALAPRPVHEGGGLRVPAPVRQGPDARVPLLPRLRRVPRARLRIQALLRRCQGVQHVQDGLLP
ncbi:hypothetical protein EE612_036043 [Oryza sativa]|nr:hypothetical protein EE612_036043 [Oryza sativa]